MGTVRKHWKSCCHNCISHWCGGGSLVAKSCPTLATPMHCSPPGSSVHGILQARILQWVVIPSPGDLPDLGIKPRSLALQADSLPAEPPRTQWKFPKDNRDLNYFVNSQTLDNIQVKHKTRSLISECRKWQAQKQNRTKNTCLERIW